MNEPLAQVRSCPFGASGSVRIAVEQGHLHADTDPEQVAFEVHGLMLAFQFEVKLAGVERAVARVEAGVNRLLDSLVQTHSRQD